MKFHGLHGGELDIIDKVVCGVEQSLFDGDDLQVFVDKSGELVRHVHDGGLEPQVLDETLILAQAREVDLDVLLELLSSHRH